MSCVLDCALTQSVGRYDVVAELSRGQSMRRILRPDFVPSLTVEAARKDLAGKDNDDTDSEQSYRCDVP
jgi:hypothetical protein